jgi:hypothetical protein
MGQKFYADESSPYRHLNGAISYPSPGPFRLTSLAKVKNCPIAGTDDGRGQPLRLTAYATGDADTWFSVPACTRYKQKHIGGYFTQSNMYGEGVIFCPYDRYTDFLPMKGE